MSLLLLFRRQAFTPPPAYVYPDPIGGAPICCERCGFRVRKVAALKKEWSGLKVCDECWDPRPAEMTAPNVYPEGLFRPGARSEPKPQFISLSNPVRPEDL